MKIEVNTMKKIICYLLVATELATITFAKASDDELFVTPENIETYDLSVLTPRGRKIYDKGVISDEGKAVGIALGSFAGFGLGHATYGKFGERGWLFLVSEIAAITLTLYGLSGIYDDSWQSSRSNTPFYLGLGLFLALKVGEIYDVATIPDDHNAEQEKIIQRLKGSKKKSAMLLPWADPLQNAGGFALSVRF